ncbi:MAG: putative toxin-antitoxin system toxin component, PIN family [Oscillospiraceae bacterium]|jgi:putative PIN family toxin of toxin-antitoxin system|nr:putative toxin-antitoxin system toxin component, PIN family [Oscillospiraceae bacterium]
MTVMLDTNIIISAGLFGGGRLTALTLRIADEFSLVLSSAIINELWCVINRKFPDKKQAMERFLKHLSFEMSYTPKELDNEIFPKIRDKKDYPILASAIIADVDVFITGDSDFTPVEIDRPEILSIRDFAEKYI